MLDTPIFLVDSHVCPISDLLLEIQASFRGDPDRLANLELGRKVSSGPIAALYDVGHSQLVI
jgi:hypothetical protein